MKSHDELSRWRKQVGHGGSNWDKQKSVDAYTSERFEWARSNFGVVHEIDIRRWVVEKASEVSGLVV